MRRFTAFFGYFFDEFSLWSLSDEAVVSFCLLLCSFLFFSSKANLHLVLSTSPSLVKYRSVCPRVGRREDR